MKVSLLGYCLQEGTCLRLFDECTHGGVSRAKFLLRDDALIAAFLEYGRAFAEAMAAATAQAKTLRANHIAQKGEAKASLIHDDGVYL